MLAFERAGSGEPVVLLHGTNADRRVWDPLLPRLTPHRSVVAVDLPAHGASPATSFTPPAFARDLAALLDDLGLDRPAVVGHSVGGWTALELAKLGRAGAVLALVPAGLWRRHSPRRTDAWLRINWRIGQLAGRTIETTLRSRVLRAAGLRNISARPGRVPYAVALQTARAAQASRHFPRHFAETRVLRFEGGERIPATVPVHVVWGEDDRVAIAGKSRHTGELPGHAVVETWPDCGHMTMWDRPEDTVRAILATTAQAAAGPGGR
jgi:pimeloyl-ACP methyl ester carboxylesterase